MLEKSTNGVMIDLLLNLLITFVALFFLSFLLVNDPEETEEGNLDSDAIFVITMMWDRSVDIDLWAKMPDMPPVFYSRREVGPAHLDLDVVSFRRYLDPATNEIFEVRPNQEILTIRGFAIEGEHIVNAHYFGGDGAETTVQISIFDARSSRMVWAGEKTLSEKGQEVHFVKFNVTNTSPGRWRAEPVSGQAEYIVGKARLAEE